jgi:hypothetical protein
LSGVFCFTALSNSIRGIEKINEVNCIAQKITRCIDSRLYRVEIVAGCTLVLPIVIGTAASTDSSIKRVYVIDSVKALMVMHQIFNLGNSDRYRMTEQR